MPRSFASGIALCSIAKLNRKGRGTGPIGFIAALLAVGLRGIYFNRLVRREENDNAPC